MVTERGSRALNRMVSIANSITRRKRSPEAEAYRRLYHTPRWRRTRTVQLRKQRLCEPCLEQGRYTIATVCHHVDPTTKLSEATFYSGPFASLCAPCHDGPTQQIERIGYSTEVGEDGWPVDPRHFSNR